MENYTLTEMATELGVTKRCLYMWKDKGYINFIKIGKKNIVAKEDVMKMRKMLGLDLPPHQYIEDFCKTYRITTQAIRQWRDKKIVKLYKFRGRDVILNKDIEPLLKRLEEENL